MKDKILYLKNNHYNDWVNVRQKVEEELSCSQTMYCVCGRLATGFHELHCKRYANKVDSLTYKKLKHLIK